MEAVAIVGVGLIGASFGLALKRAGFQGSIIGVSSPGALAEAEAVGAISSSLPLRDACRIADVVYLSQTVDRILETLAFLRPYLKSDALVTDAGSIKQAIVQQAAKCLPDIAFLGGHPLAGKETRGARAADPALFEGRPYILTPPLGPPSPHTHIFRAYLEQMGARIVEIEPEEHDEAAAFTSHLPQLLSTALAATLELAQNDNFLRVHGPGLASMTRLAASSPELWSPILAGNQPQVLNALDAFTQRLALLREAVLAGDISDIFRSGQSFAAQLREPSRSG
ncbi:MAG: prephenate dehydrogenase/arogenate dehydrogenase family protein [Bryobacteraceae bacterium]